MEWSALILGTGMSLIVLVLIFSPLEMILPAKPQKRFRPEWLLDLCYFLGQYLLWSGLVLTVLRWTQSTVHGLLPDQWLSTVSNQPFILQAVAVIFLSDLMVYWWHRLQHRVEWLWRFHAVHHTAEHLDWLAAHREHPLDGLGTQIIINLPVFLLGFPLKTLAVLVAFRGMWAIFIHSNVRITLGPWRALIGSPELHHWHHAKYGGNCNYANLFPLMDLLFGTYRCPKVEPDSLGTVEPYPRGYVAQLLYPFKNKKQRNLPAIRR